MKVQALENLIQDIATYEDVEGKPRISRGTSVALCRCNGSANKPFCDGTHRGHGFEPAGIELSVEG